MASEGRKRRARLRSAFNADDTANVFWRVELWPDWARENALSPHLRRGDRYSLFWWLTANGLEPTIAREWVLATDARFEPRTRRWRLLTGGYDNNALRQMAELVREAESGRLHLSRPRRYFDMTAGRVLE
jgi:hypothetical protein